MSSPFDELFGRRRTSSWFPDLDSMMKEMEKLMEDALKNMEQQVPKHLVKERRLDDGSVVRETGPIVYGYSVKIGEDGKPVVRKFGNLNAFPGPLGGTFSVSDQREPIVDIIKDSDRIRVVAEINSTAAAIAAITIKDIVLLFFFLFLLISIICKIEDAGFSL